MKEFFRQIKEIFMAFYYLIFCSILTPIYVILIIFALLTLILVAIK